MRMSRKIIETKEKQSVVRISRYITIDELEDLIEGQLVYDEKGMSAILLDIEIKAYKTEKHVYIKLSSNPKTILIIK
ncbi:hypothetical protein DBR40_22245 [Pedobacter sp. KBW01]|nr:hypothetical protein DBR40_22245 [Pedobacter sp. KBW01]